LPGPPSSPVACAGGAVSLLWRSRKRQDAGRCHASTAWRRWHWRSGDRPSYLSGPRWKEPRSAAERLLALETKFLLFWVGQERDSVLSRSPAPRSDCSSALRERNLPVAALWPSPNKRHARWQTLPGREGRRRPKAGAGMVRWNRGNVKPSWHGHGPLDRWTGQTKLADGMSVGPMERSSGPLPWLWPVVGLLTRSGSREFKGRPRDNKTIGSVQA
jgi:hypothetical protein